MAMVLPRQFVGKVLQYQLCLSSDIFSQVVLHSGVAVFFSILKIQEQPFFWGVAKGFIRYTHTPIEVLQCPFSH